MLQKTTIRFLKDLSANNNREWFASQRAAYENAKNDFDQFTGKLIEALSAVNPELKGLQPKDCTFRIYRDVRFSKNKDPYKTNMGVSIKEGGRKSPRCGFYFQADPSVKEGSFIAGGFWMPDAPLLRKIRQEIEYNSDEFFSVLRDRTFKKYFRDLEQDYTLKRLPKGFEAGHPAEDYLKMTSFIVSHNLTHAALTDKNLLKTCVHTYKAMLPFLRFLNRALD